jgi:hypothetical protein
VRSIMSFDAKRQQLVPGDAVDDGGDFPLGEPVEDESRDVRPSNPWRLKFRAVGDDQQDAQSSYTVYRAAEGFQARWICPMGVLKDHQHGLLLAQRFQLHGERLQRLLPPFLGCHVDRRKASITRQRQHLGEQSRVLGRGKALRQQGIQLVQFRMRCVVVRKSCGPLHLADDWMERAVRVSRGAEISQPRVRLAGETFHQRCRQSRLADPPTRRTAIRFALRQFLPSTNAAVAIRVLLPVPQALSVRCRVVRQSGFRRKLVARPPKLSRHLRHP